MVSSPTARLGRIFIHLFMLLIVSLCIIPLMAVFSTSLTSESDIAQHGYSLIPLRPDTTGYELVLKNPQTLLRAYGVSILTTLVGTLVGIVVGALCAWPLSRPDYPHRKKLAFFVMFTMLFNGGLIPTYLVTANLLQLKDNILVLILPYLANAWFIFLLRTFFQTIPMSLVEAARIDGADEFLTFRVTVNS